MGICENPVGTENRGTLTFELTTSALCDLNCSYCFEGVKSNPERLKDLDLLVARINEVIDSEWFATNYSGASISFWGGEPTLNFNYIIKLMTDFKDEDRIKFHMYSNGYNLKNMKKVIETVDCSKFEIQISYDGRLINDHFRVTHKGTSSADNVLDTFRYLADKGVTVFFKSTVPSDALGMLDETWDNFYQLNKEYKDYKNVRVSFAPTIDYSMVPNEEEKKVKVKLFRDQILKIAKKEIKFFTENNRHLCTWFKGAETKVNCAAGLNMIAVDVDGKTYACHGAMYAKGKERLQSSNLHDKNFINNITKFNDSFEEGIRDVPEACTGCVATTCIICPVTTFQVSQKENDMDKWKDRAVNGMCEFYQAFGEIDRSVQSYLRKNRSL